MKKLFLIAVLIYAWYWYKKRQNPAVADTAQNSMLKSGLIPDSSVFSSSVVGNSATGTITQSRPASEPSANTRPSANVTSTTSDTSTTSGSGYRRESAAYTRSTKSNSCFI